MRRLFFYILPLVILISACSSRVPKPRYKPSSRTTSSRQIKSMISGAKQHLGEPYRYGGTSRRGWDCSGFVSVMFNHYLGSNLPRDTRSLYGASYGVKRSKSKAGDLVFFKIRKNRPSHVGIYLGKNRFIHASTSSGVVISNLGEKYYKKYFIGFRRPKVSYLANSGR